MCILYSTIIPLLFTEDCDIEAVVNGTHSTATSRPTAQTVSCQQSSSYTTETTGSSRKRKLISQNIRTSGYNINPVGLPAESDSGNLKQ